MSRTRPGRRWLLATLTACIGAALTLISAEGLLRWMERGPWRTHPIPDNEPVMYEPHPERGWRNKPGSYDFPAYAGGAPPIQMSYRADGSRSTGSDAGDEGATLALVGGSLTQGWGISDHETFAWKIQRRFSALRVRNHGTGGYGTFQSLLALEELFSSASPPSAVLYGFAELHERRNVAAPDWLRSLATVSRTGLVAVPFATLAEPGGLKRHPPERYPAWPLRQSLATVNFFQDLYARARSRGRAAQAGAVTERLLVELHDLCKRRGARFAVVLLWLEGPTKAEYLRFLRSQGIEWIDCVYPVPLTRRVPGEGHPDGSHHTLWAECIGEALEDRGWIPSSTP